LPDAELGEYMELLHVRLAPAYGLDDIYLGCHLAALGALDSGVTCVLDFAHNVRSYEHAETMIRAWEDSGARAVVASCLPLVGERDERWRESLTRLQEERLDPAGLVGLRMGVGARVVPGMEGEIVLSADGIRFARELGIGITVDAVFGSGASDHIAEIAAEGAMGPDLTWIHCTNLEDRSWEAIAESGSKVVLAVTSDQQLACEDGVPPIQKAIDFGIEPALSVDVECCLSTDMFTQMRATLSTQRMLAAQQRFVSEAATPLLPIRSVLAQATVAGAKANGVWDRCGSLTPGKRADLLVVDAGAINNLPLNNAIGTVVLGADPRNVEAVLVDGVPRKWAGELVGVDVAALRRRAMASRTELLEKVGFDLDLVA